MVDQFELCALEQGQQFLYHDNITTPTQLLLEQNGCCVHQKLKCFSRSDSSSFSRRRNYGACSGEDLRAACQCKFAPFSGRDVYRNSLKNKQTAITDEQLR